MKYLILGIIFLCSAIGYAQSDLSASALVDEAGHVYLMWLPEELSTLKEGVKYGYTVERQAIGYGGVKIPLQQRKVPYVVHTTAPQDSSTWAANAFQSDAADILYMSVFEEDVSMVFGTDPTLTDYDNKANDVNNRYLLSVIALATDFDLSQQFGCGYYDKTTSIDSSYNYYIYINSPSVVNRAGVSIDALPAVELQSEIFPDSAIVRESEVSILVRYAKEKLPFAQYNLERRSVGSNSWVPVSALPIIPLFNADGTFVLLDSLPNCNLTYEHRITATGPFGQLTQTVLVPKEASCEEKPINILPYIDSISGYPNRFSADVTVSLPANTFNRVTEFTLEMSENESFGYKTVADFRLGQQSVSAFVDGIPQEAYFRAVVKTDQGLTFTSLVKYHQPIDELIPPPVDLIDYKWSGRGNLKLTWSESAADDVRGYRIYKANVCGGNWAEVTSGPYGDLTIDMSVDLSLGNKFLYLAIQPVDYHDNQDSVKTCIEIPRPDVHPPMGAQVINTQDEQDGLGIVIMTSPSEDVEKYRVIRRAPNSNGASTASSANPRPYSTARAGEVRLADVYHNPGPDGLQVVVDTSTVLGELYLYRVLAFDSTGNIRESPNFQAYGNGIGATPRGAPVIDPIIFRPNDGIAEIDFKYVDTASLTAFEVYRNEGPGMAFVLHATLPMPQGARARSIPWNYPNPYGTSVTVANPVRPGSPTNSSFQAFGNGSFKYIDADAHCYLPGQGAVPGYGYYIVAVHLAQNSPVSNTETCTCP